MRKQILFVFLAYAGAIRAQSPTQQFPITDPLSRASYQMELFRKLAAESNPVINRQKIAARDEEIVRLQFCNKANHFVSLWVDFASRLNDKQTFDAKLAKKLAKAFHELETSDGWPVRETVK